MRLDTLRILEEQEFHDKVLAHQDKAFDILTRAINGEYVNARSASWAMSLLNKARPKKRKGARFRIEDKNTNLWNYSMKDSAVTHVIRHENPILLYFLAQDSYIKTRHNAVSQ